MTLTPRQRAARLLRRLAARLDDRRRPARTDPPRLSVVPGGYAQGRADLALTHGVPDALRAAVTADLSRRADAVRRAARMPQHGSPKVAAEAAWRQIDAERPDLRAAADRALREMPTVVPREEWEREGLEETIARHGRAAAAEQDGHDGPSAYAHVCRCDAWTLRPALRAVPHYCRCQDGPGEPSHLPPGGPPFITDRGRC